MTNTAHPATRISTRLHQQMAALGLAAVTTLAVLSSLTQLAEGYQGQAMAAAAASAPVAVQQVIIVGQRASRG